jgi:hypothetical protein
MRKVKCCLEKCDKYNLLFKGYREIFETCFVFFCITIYFVLTHVEYRTMIRSWKKSFRQVLKREKNTKKYEQKKSFYQCNVCFIFSKDFTWKHMLNIFMPSDSTTYCVFRHKIGKIYVTQCTNFVCIFTFVVNTEWDSRTILRPYHFRNSYCR